MACENKDIGEIVKKCKVLLLDIEGTTTSISFVKDKLFPYVEENVKQFLDEEWEKEEVKDAVVSLRKQAEEDKDLEGVVAIPAEDAPKAEQIEGLVGSVKWQMSADRKAGPLKQLQGLIWKQGYDKSDIKGHVYDDVLPALEQWRSVDGHKVYIYSSGSVQAQKLLFAQSVAGDMLKLIDGHFDTAVGAKQEAASYTNIVKEIGIASDEVLFLTDILKEAEAAQTAGLNAALVSREGNAPLPADVAFPVIRSFAELAISHKRKPDPQESEVPAKVAKTDIETDLKTTTEVVEPAAETKPSEQTETMEVDDAIVTEENKTEGAKTEEATVEQTVVEEITDSNEAKNLPEIIAEPIVTEDKPDETIEKTEVDVKETESADSMETETVAENEDVKTNGHAPVAEETPPAVITEIQELEDSKPLEEVADIIDDIAPVVEEPASEDLEALQNVGEVLEKECDEILSKVQDVTNLDNIPVKPLLNTITEETMETDTTDSNDIVDRILDTELELEMKQNAEVADAKVDEEIVEQKDDQKEVNLDVAQKGEKVEQTAAEVPKEENVELNSEKNVDAEKTESTTVPEEKIEKVDECIKTVTKANENSQETKMEQVQEETKVEEVQKSEVKSTEKETPAEANGTSEPVEEKEKESPVIEVKPESEDTKINGKTNGDTETANMNGDSSKDEELSSRLSAENGTAICTNGDANGKANGEESNGTEENGKTENKPEAEVEIKVKTVAVEEPCSDQIEQPTEA